MHLIDTHKIVINGAPFVQKMTAAVKADSSYIQEPNSCYYLSCDSCEYLYIDKSWRIKDADSLHFYSIDIGLNTVLEVDGKLVDTELNATELQYEFRHFQSDLITRKHQKGKVLSIGTTDNCKLNFVFEKDKLKQVVYGSYYF